VRGQLDSAELDLGYYRQSNRHGGASLERVEAGALYGEASYIVFPWLIPYMRAVRLDLRPRGGAGVSDTLFMPGVTFLVRPNVKLMLAASIESGGGFPQSAGGDPLAWQGGGGDTGNLVLAPPSGATPGTRRQEFSSLSLLFAWAL
jgi:hypothetical protein